MVSRDDTERAGCEVPAGAATNSAMPRLGATPPAPCGQGMIAYAASRMRARRSRAPCRSLTRNRPPETIRRNASQRLESPCAGRVSVGRRSGGVRRSHDLKLAGCGINYNVTRTSALTSMRYEQCKTSSHDRPHPIPTMDVLSTQWPDASARWVRSPPTCSPQRKAPTCSMARTRSV